MLHSTQTNIGQPTLVLLHPAGFDGRIWQKATELLPDFNCVCIDLPGHGLSKGHTVTDFEEASDAVARVVEKLGTSPVHIAGISMGSYIGFYLMLRHSALVQSAILSGFQCEPIPAPALMRAMMHVSSWMINSRRTREKMARSMGVANVDLISRKGRPNASASTMRKVGRLALEFDVLDALRHISVPTLVLAGEKEHPAIKASLPVFQTRMSRCKARTIPNLGHGWIAQSPELFAETVRAWILDLTLPEELEPVSKAD
ncbi:alpha/beta hydrolase [Roseibium sp. AS2]|uniref:alpha/beta fold hydrolase n=1 Tax=Roseibium sp. AS2 TaxID=3135781 RepID=UPI0031790311